MYIGFLWFCIIAFGILLFVMIKEAEKLQKEVQELRERVAEQSKKESCAEPFEEFENRPS